MLAIPRTGVEKFKNFFSRLPLLSNEPDWRLKASLLEGHLWLPELIARRLNIFPRDGMEDEKYLEYIPSIWVACNNLQGGPMEPDLMWNMMVISLLNYQTDEFLEAVIGEHLMDKLEAVRAIVHRLCEHPSRQFRKRSYHKIQDNESSDRNRVGVPQLRVQIIDINYVEQVLHRFISYVLMHSSVLQSPLPVQHTLRKELEIFIMAHLTHAEDNVRLGSQALAMNRTTPFALPRSSYFSWVRSTSADHTSCPYSFVFLQCLMAKSGLPAFRGAKQKYLMESMCRHLATMCRQYNDFGSIARDRAEKNLNSVNFPEFHEYTRMGTAKYEATIEKDGQRLKEELMWIAEYERTCMSMTAEKFEEVGLEERTKHILRVFIDVTDLYGQIYVARDIASRMK